MTQTISKILIWAIVPLDSLVFVSVESAFIKQKNLKKNYPQIDRHFLLHLKENVNTFTLTSHLQLSSGRLRSASVSSSRLGLAPVSSNRLDRFNPAPISRGKGWRQRWRQKTAMAWRRRGRRRWRRQRRWQRRRWRDLDLEIWTRSKRATTRQRWRQQRQVARIGREATDKKGGDELGFGGRFGEMNRFLWEIGIRVLIFWRVFEWLRYHDKVTSEVGDKEKCSRFHTLVYI